jgi:LysR family glycine cleavage system transcriptional activator
MIWDMRQLPPLAAIRVFEAAARHENFTSAANELGMTQAAVSYQVKLLEERLRAPLFTREKGRARLTALGARLLPTLSGAFDAIDAAFAAHREDDEALLTIATTQTFANAWLVWRLGGFQLDHPDLAVRLTTGGTLVDLNAGEADVAIRAGAGKWDGLVAEMLMPIDYAPMCSPGFLRKVEAKLGRSIEPKDLLDLPVVVPGDEWLPRWLAKAGVDMPTKPKRGGLRLESQIDEAAAAMAGQGFVMLTPAFWPNDIAEGRLAMPFDFTTEGRFGYWLAMPPGRRNVPKIKRFREWLLAKFAELE